MKLSKDFVKAWRHWNRTPDIAVKGVEVKSNSTLQHILNELDHIDTITYMLGQHAISGDVAGMAETVSDVLSTLNELSAELETCAASRATKQPLREYIDDTRILLREILNTLSS